MESATKVAPGGLEKGSAKGDAKPEHWTAQALRANKRPLVSAEQRWLNIGPRGLQK